MSHRVIVTITLSFCVLMGCDHPLEVQGQGDIRSLSGERDCLFENSPCKNTVTDEYVETYAGIARDGHAFVGWERCGDQFPNCSYNIPADTVKKFYGNVMGSLKAVFQPIQFIVRTPDEGGVVADATSDDCAPGSECDIAWDPTRGFADIYTAEPSEGYRFEGWDRGFCLDSTYPCVVTNEAANRAGLISVYENHFVNGADLNLQPQAVLAPRFVPLYPGGIAMSPERKLHISSESFQQMPDIAALADGGYILVWNSNHLPPVERIMAQRFDQNGVPTGSELLITPNNDTSNNFPQVIALGTDRFIVTWKARLADGTATIELQAFSVDGTAVTNTIRLTPPESAGYSLPNAVEKPDGGFQLFWKSSVGEGLFQEFNAAGELIDDVKQLSPIGYTESLMGYFDDGRYVVASSDSQYPSNDRGISLQCFSADGDLLAETVAGDYQQYLNDLAIIDNQIVIAWSASRRDFTDGGTASRSLGVYARRFDNTCNALNDEFLVNTHIRRDQSDAAIAATDDDGFLIAWRSESQDPRSSTGVYAQRFDALGTKLGLETRLNAHLPYSQSDVSLALLANGGIASAWASERQDDNNYGVYGRHIFIDSDGDFLPDIWESQYNLDPAFPYDALIDTDDDGTHNLDEFELGTNPLVDES